MLQLLCLCLKLILHPDFFLMNLSQMCTCLCMNSSWPPMFTFYDRWCARAGCCNVIAPWILEGDSFSFYHTTLVRCYNWAEPCGYVKGESMTFIWSQLDLGSLNFGPYQLSIRAVSTRVLHMLKHVGRMEKCRWSRSKNWTQLSVKRRRLHP